MESALEISFYDSTYSQTFNFLYFNKLGINLLNTNTLKVILKQQERHFIQKVFIFGKKFFKNSLTNQKQLLRVTSHKHSQQITILTLKLMSHSILHYLWSADLSKNFFKLIVSIFIFFPYFFQQLFARWKKCGVTPHCLYYDSLTLTLTIGFSLAIETFLTLIITIFRVMRSSLFHHWAVLQNLENRSSTYVLKISSSEIIKGLNKHLCQIPSAAYSKADSITDIFQIIFNNFQTSIPINTFKLQKLLPGSKCECGVTNTSSFSLANRLSDSSFFKSKLLWIV